MKMIETRNMTIHRSLQLKKGQECLARRRGKNAQYDILVSVTKSLGTNSVTISKIYSISFLALSSQQKKSPFCISHPIVNPVSFFQAKSVISDNLLLGVSKSSKFSRVSSIFPALDPSLRRVS